MFISIEKTNQDIFIEIDTIRFHFRIQKYLDQSFDEWRMNPSKDNHLDIINEGTHCGYCCHNCTNPFNQLNAHKHPSCVSHANMTPVFQFMTDQLDSVYQELFEINTGKWTVVFGTSYLTVEVDGFKSTTMFSKQHMKEILKQFVQNVL
jgi:hypothetical protein